MEGETAEVVVVHTHEMQVHGSPWSKLHYQRQLLKLFLHALNRAAH